MTGQAEQSGKPSAQPIPPGQRGDSPSEGRPAGVVPAAYDTTPLPNADAGAPEAIWPAFFAKHTPGPRAVSRHVEKLHREGQHEHVIQLIQSALIHGQSQPWMYEVLALSMEIQKRPKPEIDRVVMSLADFGAADFGMMTYSAAYLAGLGRDDAALRLYREAARMSPEQPEPYILGLRIAQRLNDADGVQWGACGVLRYGWTKDYKALHREAENAAAEAAARLTKEGRTAEAATLTAAIQDARRRDLIVRLQWSGPGDLDLLVEEPSRTICSFQNPDSAGGGVLVHDGYGPRPENTYEEYVCAFGLKGDYRIRVRHAWGEIVGKRATLTIIRHQGSSQEAAISQSISLGPEEAVVRVELADGRREAPRMVATRNLSGLLDPRAIGRIPTKRPAGDIQQVAGEFIESRQDLDSRTIRPAGALFFQPVVTIIPDGVNLSAQAIVSADRRYVRLSVAPLFTNITDVFTFSFVNGVNAGGVLQPGVGTP